MNIGLMLNNWIAERRNLCGLKDQEQITNRVNEIAASLKAYAEELGPCPNGVTFNELIDDDADRLDVEVNLMAESVNSLSLLGHDLRTKPFWPASYDILEMLEIRAAHYIQCQRKIIAFSGVDDSATN